MLTHWGGFARISSKMQGFICIRIGIAFCFGFLLGWCSLQGKEPSPADQPNQPGKFKNHHLVFISIDALQASHVSCLGYPRKTTPHLDELAKNGILFTQFHSVASWTVPASMTWFTGVYPSQHKMVNKFSLYQPPLVQPAKLKNQAPELITLAEILKQNGYSTGGFTGNAGVSGGFGYEQGFDLYQHPQGVFGNLDYSIPRAINWLKDKKDKRDTKWFLFLHGYDVHGQCMPAGGYDFRFVDKNYSGQYLGSEREQELLREIGLDKGSTDLSAEDIRFWRAIYDEKIQRADEKIGNFLKEYRKLGLMDQTIFIITSDHGTEFFEHKRVDHGFTLYEEQIRVPLIVVLPGQKKGQVISSRLSSIDLMPTILDLLEIEPPERVKKQLMGKSLRESLKGNQDRRDLFCETDYREYTFKRAILSPDGWKLIATMENGDRELFYLGEDPGELTNLVSRKPAKARELEDRLFAHFRLLGHDLSKRVWKKGLNPVYNSQAK